MCKDNEQQTCNHVERKMKFVELTKQMPLVDANLKLFRDCAMLIETWCLRKAKMAIFSKILAKAMIKSWSDAKLVEKIADELMNMMESKKT